MNIFRFFREIGNYSGNKAKGLRGTTSGKLYVDKSVFYQREDVKAAIDKLKNSAVIQQQLRAE